MRQDKTNIIGGLYLVDKNFKQPSEQKYRNTFNNDETAKKALVDRPLS
jgi:hypothetical protein